MAVYVSEVTGLPYNQASVFVQAIVDGDVTTPDARYWDRETFKTVLKALFEKYQQD